MAESNLHKDESLASAPDELVKDLNAEVSEPDQNAVVGGKTGKGDHEYLIIKMTDVIITSVNPSGSSA